MCLTPRGRAYTCPACQKAKIACRVDKVSRRELGQPKRKKARLEIGCEIEEKSGSGSGVEKGMGAVVELLQLMLEENREHHARVEAMLSESLDPTYVPPLGAREPDYEWRPMMEAERELHEAALREIRVVRGVPLEWSYSAPFPAIRSAEMGPVWDWFYRKGDLDVHQNYTGGYTESESEKEGEGGDDVVEVEKDPEVQEVENEEGAKGVGAEEVEQGKEMDTEVQEVEKGAEDMDME